MTTTAFQRMLSDSKKQWKSFRREDLMLAVPVPVTVGIYEACLRQFRVDLAPRYQPRDGLTFCNIFISDATLALGCELPHLVDGKEQRMNDLIETVRDSEDWVQQFSYENAVAVANAGMPSLVLWHSGGNGPGHGAFVMPQEMPISLAAVKLAQAGAACGYGLSLGGCFGRKKRKEVEFWVHR
jgi:hypothetical protein